MLRATGKLDSLKESIGSFADGGEVEWLNPNFPLRATVRNIAFVKGILTVESAESMQVNLETELRENRFLTNTRKCLGETWLFIVQKVTLMTPTKIKLQTDKGEISLYPPGSAERAFK